MKYFFIIIIILFTIAYQVSSTNEETLAEAEAEAEVVKSEEAVVEDNYQNIDLKKITLNTPTPSVNSDYPSDDTSINEDDENPDVNDIDTSNDDSDQADSEVHEEFVQSKYSQEAHLANRPDKGANESQTAMEQVRRDMINKSRKPAGK